MEQVYYAHIDKSELLERQRYMELHCLPAEPVDGLLLQQHSLFRQSVLDGRDVVITVTAVDGEIAWAFAEKGLEESEGSWMRIYTNRNGQGLPAILFLDLEEPSPIYIEKAEKLKENDELRNGLDKQLSLDEFEDADMDALDAALQGRRWSPEFVSVYNVWQGGCSAVCDADGVPILYFDLGGGCYGNRHTYPVCLDFCFSYNPPVILSHWDTDHYQSARLNPEYRRRTWIVPRQPIGPVHYRFLASLQQVLVWPRQLSSLGFYAGAIVRCTGSANRKNHSGLALCTSLATQSNSIRRVLLPADAAYAYIPIAELPFDGVVATHHGAVFDHGNAPVPPSQGRAAIAYSYGHLNTYQHPRQEAIQAHLYNWPHQPLHTLNGHIAMTDGNRPLSIPCGAQYCSLQPVQFY